MQTLGVYSYVNAYRVLFSVDYTRMRLLCKPMHTVHNHVLTVDRFSFLLDSRICLNAAFNSVLDLRVASTVCKVTKTAREEAVLISIILAFSLLFHTIIFEKPALSYFSSYHC